MEHNSDNKEPDPPVTLEDTVLESDQSLQNIIAALKSYQTILNNEEGPSMSEYAEQTKGILNDYITILRTYLSNTIQQNNKTFEAIYTILSKHIQCDIKKCKPYSRNNRDRATQSMNTKQDHDVALKRIFCTDLMDNIHCYFMHSYDIGFRIRHSEWSGMSHKLHDKQPHQTNNNNQKLRDLDDTSFITNHIDDGMKTFSAFLQSKRASLRNIRGAKRTQNNKFSTFVNETKTELESELSDENESKSNDNDSDHSDGSVRSDDDTKTDEKEIGSFSFGYRYYYWIQKETLYSKDRWYIPKAMCKYDSLKDEIINNSLYKLSLEAYNVALEKALQYAACDYIKRMKANNILCRYYGVEKHSIMDIEHILSLILYSDFDLLSYTFSSTFRRNNTGKENQSAAEIRKELKQRNAEYWHWSKALRESVELWGIPLDSTQNKYKIFYHGTSHLIFDKLVAKFSSPTSTTSSIQVAIIFAKENGMILELEQYTGYGSDLRYFNMNVLSAFSNEDEKLFFGGKKPLKLGAIRNIRENENYRLFFDALTICQIAVRGMNNTIVSDPTSTDYAIIDRLCKHQQSDGVHKAYRNKFPVYVNKLFQVFAQNQISLAFSFDNMRKYIGILDVLGVSGVRGLLKFDYLLRTFPNCEYITILECASNAAKVDTFMIQFTQAFCDALLQVCERMNQNEECKIQTILFRHNVEFESDQEFEMAEQMEYYFELEKRFAAKGWVLWFEKDKPSKQRQGKSLSYTMTLKKGSSANRFVNRNMARIQKRQHSMFLHNFDGMQQMQKPIMSGQDLEYDDSTDDDDDDGNLWMT
eukprot:302544_1